MLDPREMGGNNQHIRQGVGTGDSFQLSLKVRRESYEVFENRPRCVGPKNLLTLTDEDDRRSTHGQNRRETLMMLLGEDGTILGCRG